jgi:hypothetical protein
MGEIIYMGRAQGLEKVNDTCVKIMLVGTMDRGFTIYPSTWFTAETA